MAKIGIVGAGHNGLVCGFYLARAGHSVTIFEKRDTAGGLCVNEELIQGYKVPSYASWYGMLQPEIVKDLGLEKNGITSKHPEFLLFDDGTYVSGDLAPNTGNIKNITVKDIE